MIRVYNEWLAGFCESHPDRFIGLVVIPNNPLDAAIAEVEKYPRIKLVLGESGIGWIPYVLWRMDAEWEDQFKDLSLKMPPSDYWKRQCYATYQTDPIGVKLIDELGADRIMWGSDSPHPDGIWPDAQEYIKTELGHLPADVRRKVICENAGSSTA